MTHIVVFRNSSVTRNQGIGMWYPTLISFKGSKDRDEYLRSEIIDSGKYRTTPIPWSDGQMVGGKLEFCSGTKMWAIDLAIRAFENRKSLIHRPNELPTLPTIYEVDPESGGFSEITDRGSAATA